MVNMIKVETVEKIGRSIEEERGLEECKKCGCAVGAECGVITPSGFICMECLPIDEEELAALYQPTHDTLGGVRDRRRGRR